MTGINDITVCADIVYGKHFKTPLSQESPIFAKIHFSDARTDSGTVYAIVNWTS